MMARSLKFVKAAKPDTKKAIRLSREFFGFDPRTLKQRDLKWPKSLILMGACRRVDYLTDKFDGIFRQYYHDFNKKCVLLGSPDTQKNGDGMLIILGKFKITKSGITG